MKRILMVCLGNICRSPLAEGILQNKANKAGVSIEVDSAGTAAYHAGERPDIRSQEIARKHGIDLSKQRARKFVTADFDTFDLIFVMDQANYADVIAKARHDQDINKVSLILNKAFPGSNRQVPDPYYGGKDGFQHVYNLLDSACDTIIKELH